MDPACTDAAQTRVRLFANFLKIGYNRLEFVLDFVQVHDGEPEHVTAALVAAPAHVKQFAELMQGCIADYEQRYGVITMDRSD